MAIICGRENLSIKGRFGYRVGVFVSKLSKESIEFQIRRELDLASEDEWKTIGSAFTGSRGRVTFRYYPEVIIFGLSEVERDGNLFTMWLKDVERDREITVVDVCHAFVLVLKMNSSIYRKIKFKSINA